jgi:outer membrane receptor for ferrienterochelin and colicins
VRSALTFLAFFIFTELFSQTRLLKGKVVDLSDTSYSGLPGAILKAKGSKLSTSSDLDGNFTLQINSGGDTLITFLTSFKNDTSIVGEKDSVVLISLSNALKLKEVEVKYKGTGTELSMLNTMKLETLGEKSLMKAACCNLSESFETNPSVDVNFADAVSGAKQIQLLGLGGQYAQITKENMPYMRGLANAYGLTFIPGTWIKSIQLGKGAGSVVNGYESFSGQINTELQHTDEGDHLHFNTYANENGRNEYNLNVRQKLTKTFSTALLSHVSFNPLAEDHNNDHFMDIPTGRQYNFTNKYQLVTTKRFEWQFGGSYLYDERLGGQVNLHSDTTLPYLVGIRNEKYDVFSKSGYVFRRPSTSMGLQLNYLNHDLNSFYGISRYNGKQQTTYANYIFESYILNTNYKYKLGTSYLNDIFNETFNAYAFKRNETSIGVFGEFVFNYKDRFNVIFGSRVDNNNYYGTFYTPRLHMRFAWNESKTVLRLSGGRALRTANVFAENMNYMASSREWVILQTDSTKPYGLLPEIGWNYGINFTQKFKMNYKEAYVTLDIYRTDFVNQVIVDADQNPQELYIYNLFGKSFSNTAQFEFGWEIRKRLFVKTAYRYVQNIQTYLGGEREKALISRDRAFINFSYETKNEHWTFDATCQYNGSKRLPITEGNPSDLQLAQRSPEFYNVLGQITYIQKWEKSEFNIYLGVENALNYKQMNPILSSSVPYSKYFDAAMVWGPIYGRMLYMGLRFKVK